MLSQFTKIFERLVELEIIQQDQRVSISHSGMYIYMRGIFSIQISHWKDDNSYLIYYREKYYTDLDFDKLIERLSEIINKNKEKLILDN